MKKNATLILSKNLLTFIKSVFIVFAYDESEICDGYGNKQFNKYYRIVKWYNTSGNSVSVGIMPISNGFFRYSLYSLFSTKKEKMI